MNLSSPCSGRRVLAAIAFATFLLLTGCLEKRLVWSPDGNSAAIIGDDGLYLCDSAGHLSPRLASDVRAVAWLPDSKRLVIARHRELADWASLASVLGENREAIESAGQVLWRRIQDGAQWKKEIEGNNEKDQVLRIWLRAHHGDELNTRENKEVTRLLEETRVMTSELLIAVVEGQKLAFGDKIGSQVGEVTDIRVAPRGDAVAWTRNRFDAHDQLEAVVASLASPGSATRVGRCVAGYPDWSADGQSLVYVEASAGGDDQGRDDVVLGVLTKRRVLDEHGGLMKVQEPVYLAGLLFNQLTHVRCLADGRVVFNAVEMTLPMAAADYGGDQREQLYCVDGARQSTLVRLIPRKHESNLPQMLAFFEASPDGTQIVIGGPKNEVAVLTIATGEVECLQEGGKETFQGVPTWRRGGEFTYVKVTPQADHSSAVPSRPAEIVLRRGDKEVVLSRDWPADVLARIASESRR